MTSRRSTELSPSILTIFGFAKSLLGMFLLSLNEPLQLVLEDDVDATALFKDLADYLEIDDE